MVDRFWANWQALNPDAEIPKEVLDIELSPFPLTVADVLEIEELGYAPLGSGPINLVAAISAA